MKLLIDSIDTMTGERTKEEIEVPGLPENWKDRHYPDVFCRAMARKDEEDAGLPPGEGAGYDILAWCPNGSEAAFVLRTRGLGPKPEDNALVVGVAYSGSADPF